jgi:hypothetical protein
MKDVIAKSKAARAAAASAGALSKGDSLLAAHAWIAPIVTIAVEDPPRALSAEDSIGMNATTRWRRLRDQDGVIYFEDWISGATVWDLPEGANVEGDGPPT